MQNIQPKFYCQSCDYSCSRKSLWDQHLDTLKHQKAKNANLLSNEANTKYTCENCNITFKHQSSYCRHKKKCEQELSHVINTPPNKDDVFELVKCLITENAELKTLMVEQQTKMMEQQNLVLEIAKNGINNTNTNTNSHNTSNNTSNNNTTTNNNNKTFNLNFFLNETCKNAMNLNQFVDEMVLNLSDLEETGRIGFAEGISNMIMKRLRALDVTERPIHCSDLKRETLYIKNENKWEKEDENKPILTNAVKNIAGKNMMQIFDWQKAHPDYNDPDTRTSDKYMKMLTNVMSGGTEEETNANYDKIIRNLIKEAAINKENYLI